MGEQQILKRYAVIGLALSVFALLGGGESHAQAVDAAAIPQQIELYDAILKYPQPAWISGETETDQLLDQSEFYRDHAGSQFILEQIPDGEKFASWTRLYAVAAEELGVGQTASMQDFIALATEQNGLACAEGAFGVQTLHVSEGDALLAMVCGATAKGPTSVGYGPDVGEVSVWRFLIFEDTYVKVYQRWRGAAFGLEERDAWPVSKQELNEMVRRMTDVIEIFPNTARQ